MNSFAHALPFLNEDPFFPIGCALPDWLGAVDRRCRIRKNRAEKFVDTNLLVESPLARGVIQHIDDDRWFHSSAAFTQMSMKFAVELRGLLVDEPGFRPGFLGHIVIELLLDGYLHRTFPGQLEEFYQLVENTEAAKIQAAVNAMATQPTQQLADYFPVFLRERYLFDYLDDERLLYRLNHVLKRVKLKAVGAEVLAWLPSARQRVDDEAAALLENYTIDLPG